MKQLFLNSVLKQVPRATIGVPIFVAKDVQAAFEIPTWLLLMGLLPGIIVLTMVSDVAVQWLRRLLLNVTDASGD